MAIEELEILARPQIESAKAFLRENWGQRVSLDDILPLVLIQRGKPGKPRVYPVVAATNPSGRRIGCEAIGNNKDSRLLFVVDLVTQETNLYLGRLENPDRWKFSGVNKRSGDYISAFEGARFFDYFRFGSKNAELQKMVAHYNFGIVKDKVTGFERELILIKLSRINTAGTSLDSRVKTVQYMEELIKRGVVQIGAPYSTGTVIKKS